MKLRTLFLFFSVTTSPLLGMTNDSVEDLGADIAHVNFHESDHTTDPSVNNKSESAGSAGDTKSATPPAIDEKEITDQFAQILRKAKSAHDAIPPASVHGYTNESLEPRINYIKTLLACIDECFACAVHVDDKKIATWVAKVIKELHLNFEHSVDYETPLCQSVKAGNCNAVRTLCLAGAKLDGHNSNETLLHLAAESGHNDICKFLLEHKVSVNAACLGQTPLHYAAKKGHAKVCSTLLAANANPKASYEDFRESWKPITPKDCATGEAIVAFEE